MFYFYAVFCYSDEYTFYTCIFLLPFHSAVSKKFVKVVACKVASSMDEARTWFKLTGNNYVEEERRKKKNNKKR